MRIPAAGTLPWRLRDDVLEIALVHRPRYDDWSWPKGKLDPGEDWAVAAARETQEETGLAVRLGMPLPGTSYTVLAKDGTPDEKVVRYWAATVIGGSGALVNEIDEVAWLDAQAAFARLDYTRDRDQLLAVVRAHQAGQLDTVPVAVVRHAKAIARGDYKGKKDWLRPLDEEGLARAAALPDLLAAYGIERLVSSPSTRCHQTFEPSAKRLGVPIKHSAALSEEGYAQDASSAPEAITKILTKAVAARQPVAVCSHGPVLPAVLDVLVEHLDLSYPGAVELVETFAEARDDRLVKGEALICHIARTDSGGPRIVAAERHTP